MPIQFHGNAVVLSGETGTKLKSDVLGSYFPFWWQITSGGKKQGHPLNTAIIDLNAATGKVYIEETGEEVFGSAGHALKLKIETLGTNRLKIILVEERPDCFSLLQNVIQERWPEFALEEAKGPVEANKGQVYLLNSSLDQALNAIDRIDGQSRLGLAIFLFDPLRSIAWETVQKVALRRIPTFYKIGTEFIIFLFTSDFFLGRDQFAALPTEDDATRWTQSQNDSVVKTDAIFPNKLWRQQLLTGDSVKQREDRMVTLYREALHSWFRYVLPLPFRPKREQVYHLFFCSNYETGIRQTRSLYAKKAMNPKVSLSINDAYERFQRQHPENIPSGPSGRTLEFRTLWRVIRDHEEGYCDVMCQDLIKEDSIFERRRNAIDWLYAKGYLKRVHYDDAWGKHPPTYLLNWTMVETKIGVAQPLPLTPLPPVSEQKKLL